MKISPFRIATMSVAVVVGLSAGLLFNMRNTALGILLYFALMISFGLALRVVSNLRLKNQRARSGGQGRSAPHQ